MAIVSCRSFMAQSDCTLLLLLLLLLLVTERFS
jgi:hypothetical protein